MKRVVFLFFILLLGMALFAQTNYFFVLEKPDAEKDISIYVFQTLVAALVEDNDTFSAICFTDKAAYLFGPLPGNTPELVRIAGEKLRSDPLKGNVTTEGIIAAIELANDQSKTQGQPKEASKLVIVTASLSTGKAKGIADPDAFSKIYYIALDAPLETGIIEIAEPKAEGKDFSWAIDTEHTPPEPDCFSLADGIFNCVQANNPKYRKINPVNDFTEFSIGFSLYQIRKSVILAQNTSDGAVVLNKSGRAVVSGSDQPVSSYSVLQPESMGFGKYTLENGNAILILTVGGISIFVFIAAGIILAVVLIVVIAKIAAAAAKAKKQMRPVYYVSYNQRGRDSGKPKAKICKKCNHKHEDEFESPVPIKKLVEYIGIKDMLDPKVVDDRFPRIVYDEKRDIWFIEYNPETGAAYMDAEAAQVEDMDPDIFSLGGSSTPQADNSDYDNSEDDLPRDEQVQGSTFKIKRVFQNDDENKLVLTRVEE